MSIFTRIKNRKSQTEVKQTGVENNVKTYAPVATWPAPVATPTIGKLITDRSAFFTIGGTSYTMDATAAQFPELVEELSKADPDPERLVALVEAAVDEHPGGAPGEMGGAPGDAAGGAVEGDPGHRSRERITAPGRRPARDLHRPGGAVRLGRGWNGPTRTTGAERRAPAIDCARETRP